VAKLALLISLVALGIAVLAYQEAGGTKDLARRVETLRQDLRQETADGLAKLEKALRGGDPARPRP
jgi:hypothetical protein